MLCDRETTKIAGGQAGFIQFVVMPIFKQVADVVPEIDDLQLAGGYSNIESWKVRAENEAKQEEKEKKMKEMLEEAQKQKEQKSEEQNDKTKASL